MKKNGFAQNANPFSVADARAICAVRAGKSARQLNSADIARFFTLGSRRALEGNTLVFGKAFETFRLDILEMGKQIAAACVRRNEAKAFGIVEPFYSTSLSIHF